MSVHIALEDLKVIGSGDCVGGKHPDPPLDDFPLLAWMPNHPVHGGEIITEDGKVTVHQIALALAQTPHVGAIAKRFGTTEEHVTQAVGYAIKAGLLG